MNLCLALTCMLTSTGTVQVGRPQVQKNMKEKRGLMLEHPVLQTLTSMQKIKRFASIVCLCVCAYMCVSSIKPQAFLTVTQW